MTGCPHPPHLVDWLLCKPHLAIPHGLILYNTRLRSLLMSDGRVKFLQLCTHRQTHTQTCTQGHTNNNHTHTHPPITTITIHTHTHTRTHTHTHTHAHTQTPFSYMHSQIQHSSTRLSAVSTDNCHTVCQTCTHFPYKSPIPCMRGV